MLVLCFCFKIKVMENNKVKFDPGFAPVVMEYLGKVGYMYYMFNSIQDKKMKKINFNFIYKKLEENLKMNISFYMGCLLWASCIVDEKDKELDGNKLLGEVCEEKEYTDEINFLIDFIEKSYPRDTKYYQNRIFVPNSKYLPILKAYKDFLVLNKGFCNTSNTNQIVMPEYLKVLSKENISYIKEKIQNAIDKKDLSLLLEEFSYLF